MPALPSQVPQQLLEGVTACRRGDWRGGLTILTRLAQEVEGTAPLPGYFYSYLGVAMARVEGRKREGLELARYGVSLAPRDPENRLNLARAYLVSHNRRMAVKQLEAGLEISPANAGLNAFRREIGHRRPPVLRFLRRSNPINVWLGKLRFRSEQRRRAYEELLREEAEIERLAGRG